MEEPTAQERAPLGESQELGIYALIANTEYIKKKLEALYFTVNLGEPEKIVTEQRCRDVVVLDFINSVKHLVTKQDVDEITIVRVLNAFFQHCRINEIEINVKDTHISANEWHAELLGQDR